MIYKDPVVRKIKSGERWKRWATRNKEKANLRMKEWRQRNPKYMLHVSAKRRATKDGTVFSITIDDIPDIPEVCPILGIALFQRDDGTKGPCANSPTLDKINPELGYVKNNIAIISFKANKMKSDMSIENLEKILSYMKEGICDENP
jgi:hypothetical protein